MVRVLFSILFCINIFFILLNPLKDNVELEHKCRYSLQLESELVKLRESEFTDKFRYNTKSEVIKVIYKLLENFGI